MPAAQPEVNLEITRPYVSRFTRRAAWLFVAAGGILVVILALLALGAFVFVSASGIAARDISRRDSGDLLATELRRQRLISEIGFLRAITPAYESMYELHQVSLAEVSRAGRGLSAAMGRLKLVEHKLLTYRRTGFLSKPDSFDDPQELRIAQEVLEADLLYLNLLAELSRDRDRHSEAERRALEAEIGESEADLEFVETLLDEALAAAEASQGPASNDATALDPETVQIIQTNITRFGTLLLVFFFIRIMLPIYRYFVGLGTFYRGQADALFLVRQTGHPDLAALVAAMTPQLGFGRTPSTPVDNTLQLIKEIAPLMARR